MFGQGVIPKNQFGNIDLYVPAMLPHGGVHIPCEWRIVTMLALEMNQTLLPADKGVAKIAKKLGFDYAEAVVSAFYHDRRIIVGFPRLADWVRIQKKEGVSGS